VGLLKPMSSASKLVASKLTDSSELFAGRVHPMTILLAMRTYESGHGLKGSLAWNPERQVVDALDEAFYLAFQAIEPTGKRTLLALDVSGSMGTPIAGTSLSCREATAAMAMVTARTEKEWHCVAFTASNGRPITWQDRSRGNAVTPLSISPRQRLTDAVNTVSGLPFGNTDCALPMLYALEHKIPVDAFVIYTDNETWAGSVHPHEALDRYRQKMGIAAKFVAVGMASTEYSVGNDEDTGSLNVVGFDAAAPGIIADFIAGREVQK
jgi:60 kDa SS-A/Ro ribonucleoprotein